MKIETFSKLVLSEVVLLVITFLLGMDINLYTNIPSNIFTASFWESSSSWIIRFHMIVGTAILAIAIILVVSSLKFKDIKQGIKVPSIVGLISIITAYLSGLTFLFLGANNIFSYLMAIGFIFAIVSYMVIVGALRYGKR